MVLQHPSKNLDIPLSILDLVMVNVDGSQAKQCIAELAVLLSHLRCDVQTWREGSDIGYSPSLPEHPQRAAEILFNLAKGHALLSGRNFVTMQDVPIIVKTVFLLHRYTELRYLVCCSPTKEVRYLYQG